MNKKLTNCLVTLMLVASATAGINAAQKEDNAMTKMADGSYVVNTTTLANDVKGYRGTTPLKITIKKDILYNYKQCSSLEYKR